MLTLAFEVLPKPGHEETYLTMAAALRPALETSGGLLFLDRSRSASRPGWFLSHQAWRDEASMARWRAHPAHHRAQVCGRTDVLADYRLRVAQVVAHVEPAAASGRQIVHHDMPADAAYAHPDTGPERVMLSVVARGGVPSVPGLEAADRAAERFGSVYEAGLEVALWSVASRPEGVAMLAALAATPGLVAARLAVVSRDYGLFDRREAPQFFEPVV